MRQGGDCRVSWLVITVLLVMALLAGACSSPQGRSCTLLGCNDRVTATLWVELVESLREDPQQVLMATMCVEPGDHCSTTELRPSERTGGRVSLTVQLDPGTLDRNETHDASITIAGPDGDVRFEHVVPQFQLERFQPNRDCPPICGTADLPVREEPTTTIAPGASAPVIVPRRR